MKNKIINICVILYLALSLPLVLFSINKLTYMPEPLSYQEAWELLDGMEHGHQNVVDNPRLIEGANTGIVGDVEFHKKCVKEYQQLKLFISGVNK